MGKKKLTKSGLKIVRKKLFNSDKTIEVIDVGDGVFMTMKQYKAHLRK